MNFEIPEAQHSPIAISETPSVKEVDVMQNNNDPSVMPQQFVNDVIDPISTQPNPNKEFPKSSEVVNSLLQLTIPMTDCPKCTVEVWNTKFFGQTFS